MPSGGELLVRILLGFALAFIIGFEREIRGSAAGDRTFSLVGGTAAALTAVLLPASPQAVAGILTGIGFIGGGVVFHGEGGLVRGITTAAGVFAVAGTGIVIGSGHLLAGTVTAILVLLVLELRNLPLLRTLDARRYRTQFRADDDPPLSRKRPSSAV